MFLRTYILWLLLFSFDKPNMHIATSVVNPFSITNCYKRGRNNSSIIELIQGVFGFRSPSHIPTFLYLQPTPIFFTLPDPISASRWPSRAGDHPPQKCAIFRRAILKRYRRGAKRHLARPARACYPPRMKLDLDIRPGRRPEPLRAEVLRELAVEDVALLHAARGTEPPEIKKVSERHHALARAIASGLSNAEAAAAVGYDPARVSILKNSPAFQELLDLYRSQADAEFAELQGRLAGLSKQAVLELMDRLETDPESISVGQLLEMVKTGADRTGHGPSSKQETTLNINLADRLEAARKRALEAQMIDVTPEDQA